MFNEIDIDKILSFKSKLNPIQVCPRFKRENLIKIKSKQNNELLTNKKYKAPKHSLIRIDERWQDLRRKNMNKNEEIIDRLKGEINELRMIINGERNQFQQELITKDAQINNLKELNGDMMNKINFLTVNYEMIQNSFNEMLEKYQQFAVQNDQLQQALDGIEIIHD